MPHSWRRSYDGAPAGTIAVGQRDYLFMTIKAAQKFVAGPIDWCAQGQDYDPG